MIQVDNVIKRYGKGENQFTALNGVSVRIPTGTTAAIIGKSGSGKSTLMHIMSGLDRPTTGSITINDERLDRMKRRAMDRFRSQTISFIFQSFFVEAQQTCFQNVSLPLEIAGVPLLKRKALVTEALAAVDLADKVRTPAGNLSGGQKQRLAIARAIVGKPSIIFADEPTGNLDSATGELIVKLLFDLNKQLGCTIILVTHDNDLAQRCQQRIELKDGALLSARQGRK